MFHLSFDSHVNQQVMKKSTKSEKPAAPQVKSVVPKPVEPKPVKKTAAPSKKTTPKVEAAPVAASKPALAPVKAAPAKAAQAKAAPAKAAAAAAPAAPVAPAAPLITTISAQIDIGFGNTLFVRGEGPGLSWDRGLAMECEADDLWSVSLPAASRPIVFKFLVNDLSWSSGSDFVVAPGSKAVLTPEF